MSTGKSFKKEYGTAVDLPVNAVLYELTDGGKLVIDPSDPTERLQWAGAAHHTLAEYSDMQHMSQDVVRRQARLWMETLARSRNLAQQGDKSYDEKPD